MIVARRRRVARLARSAWAVVLGFFLLLARREIASAHATLVHSEPGAGSVIATSPERVRLVFSDDVEAELAQVTILTAGGDRVRLPVTRDPRDVHALIATLDSDEGPLAAGAYRVVWRVVSEDGHPIDGSFVFAVGAAMPPVEKQPAAPPEGSSDFSGPTVEGAPVFASVLRGLGVGALMALGGLLLFMVWRPVAPARRARTIALVLAVLAPLLLGAHLVAWLAHSAPGPLDAEWATTTLGTTLGRIELARCALAILALWALALARRPGLALVFTVAAILVSAAVGHSAAVQAVWSVPAKALHLLAAAAWIGGLLWLILRDRGESADANATTTSRVSAVALAAVGVVTISGAVQTLILLPSLRDLYRTPYGLIVLAKLAGLGVLVLFGAYHRFRVMPRLAGSASVAGFNRSLTWEVAVMSLVILLGGWLGYVPTPHDMGSMHMGDMPGMSAMHDTPDSLHPVPSR